MLPSDNPDDPPGPAHARDDSDSGADTDTEQGRAVDHKSGRAARRARAHNIGRAGGMPAVALCDSEIARLHYGRSGEFTQHVGPTGPDGYVAAVTGQPTRVAGDATVAWAGQHTLVTVRPDEVEAELSRFMSAARTQPDGTEATFVVWERPTSRWYRSLMVAGAEVVSRYRAGYQSDEQAPLPTQTVALRLGQR